MSRSSFLVLACILALGGCAVPQPQNTPVAPKLMVEPITGRPYYLYVPSTYREGVPAPLIVTCHGTDPFDVAAYQVGEWKMLAERHGCVLVCPKLTSTDGIFGAGAHDRLLDDEKLIMSIVGQMHYLFDIDRRNVLMTGFSGGGFPVYFIGLRHPDVFTAVIARNCNFNARSVHGWYPPEARALPLMIYYGQADPLPIQVQSEEAISFFRAAGFNIEVKVVPGGGHQRTPEVAMDYWLRHWNGQRPTPSLYPVP